jgi:RimJ/RimL family protein N-acetyltransferase
VKHNIHIEGYAYSLRPVELEDAQFIVEVRTPEHSQFMHWIDRSVEAQRKWLERYFERPNEYYFVVQRKNDGNREGLTGLLDFDERHRSAQWGRVVLRPGSLAAAEMALLILRLCFDIFRLSEVWGVTLAENTQMISYVESCGFEPRELITVHVDGKARDGAKHVLTADRWREFEEKVSQVALRIAQRSTPR